jgi:hypothetical protein
MLSILVRYNWQQFSIVTSEIAGHDDFIQAVRDKVATMKSAEEFSFNIQSEVKVKSKEDLRELELSETRIILLYSTRQEGSQIMRWAGQAGLTGNSFVWIATQSVIGEHKDALPDLPAGMLGNHHFLCSKAVILVTCRYKLFIKPMGTLPSTQFPSGEKLV